MQRILLITHSITPAIEQQLLKTDPARFASVFWFGQALVSLPHLTPSSQAQIQQWCTQVKQVGYCDSVVTRHQISSELLSDWEPIGLTQFYVNLHDCAHLEQL
jgi:hypothetical protein